MEGASDSGAASRVIEYSGHQVGKIVNKRGKGNLDPDIRKYAQAAAWQPWVVFRDSDSECPVDLSARLLQDVKDVPANFHLRLAHSMTEAWLLADQAGFSAFFNVPEAAIPRDVESIPHAKHEVLRLCAGSRSRAIREAMVTTAGEVGPLFVATVNDFARLHWDISAAMENTDSLARAVQRIGSIKA